MATGHDVDGDVGFVADVQHVEVQLRDAAVIEQSITEPVAHPGQWSAPTSTTGKLEIFTAKPARRRAPATARAAAYSGLSVLAGAEPED